MFLINFYSKNNPAGKSPFVYRKTGRKLHGLKGRDGVECHGGEITTRESHRLNPLERFRSTRVYRLVKLLPHRSTAFRSTY